MLGLREGWQRRVYFHDRKCWGCGKAGGDGSIFMTGKARAEPLALPFLAPMAGAVDAMTGRS
jgi:hypothetical protein